MGGWFWIGFWSRCWLGHVVTLTVGILNVETSIILIPASTGNNFENRLCKRFTSQGMKPYPDRSQWSFFTLQGKDLPEAKGDKTMDVRFSGVGLFRNNSACRATDLWTKTEVMKEMDNRFKTMPHLQSVMVKKTSQEEERGFLSQLSASWDTWQKKDGWKLQFSNTPAYTQAKNYVR